MNKCLRKLALYCYVCGKFSIASNLIGISVCAKEWYEHYFGMQVVQGVNWAPKDICRTCYDDLRLWFKGTKKSLKFGVPMIWTDPGKFFLFNVLNLHMYSFRIVVHSGEHIEASCYMCLNDINGKTKRSRRSMKYIGTDYVSLPLSHSDAIPIPRPPSPTTISIWTANLENQLQDPDYEISEASKNMIPISQNWMDDVIKHVNLSKRDAEYIAHKLNQNNLLTPDVKVTGYRHRQVKFEPFFSANEENTFVYCNNIEKLVAEMGMTYIPHEWRLFIDSSKTSMKAVLLYYNNKKPSVPIAYNLNTKESYESVRHLLEAVNYESHKWRICCDLKMVALLCGLQGGYTKNMCFICLWNTRYKGNQYQNHDWENREDLVVGSDNVIHKSLVPIEKVLLPPLHIKLGIFKNFVKALPADGPAFITLRSIFPRLSASKVKEGI